MKFDERRGSVVAAKSIINSGLKQYFNDGVRIGFYSEEDDPKKIVETIIKILEEYNEFELANLLNKSI